jgi:4-amino-4-deoxy-L-arabinose transferase-like glycosyltransferase
MTKSVADFRWPFWMLLGLFTLIWFGSLDYRHLVKPDEGRYAEISREMANTGDWITPRLNGIKYFEKPPLQYWITALAYQAFGVNEWTARLWTAVSGFLGIFVIGFAGSRLFGSQAGQLGALFLASNLYYVALGHINTLDMGLTFFLTVSLAAFLLAQKEPPGAARERKWMLIAWGAAACAVLSKGLIGVVIPAATLVIYSLLNRDITPWRRLHVLPGLALFLVIAAPWFIAVTLRNPEFPNFFFIHEHFQRYTSNVHRREEAPWYFLAILVIGLIPWIPLALHGAAKAWHMPATKEFSAQRFLVVWCGFVLLFFSVSGSKLPAYLLPLFPALALLLGPYLSAVRPPILLATISLAIAISLLGLIALPFALDARSESPTLGLYRNYAQWLNVAFGALGLVGLLAFFKAKQAQVLTAFGLLGAAGFLATMFGLLGHESLARSNSSAYLAQQIKPMLRADIPLYSVKTYDQTLPFYLNRTMTLVEYQDEFEFGQQQQPEKSIPSVAEFESIWRSGAPALALLDPEQYAAFIAAGLPMRLITQDTRRVIIATP